jgi:hypothetical protein
MGGAGGAPDWLGQGVQQVGQGGAPVGPRDTKKNGGMIGSGGGGKRGGDGERGTKKNCHIASLSSLNSQVFPYGHQMTQISFCIDEKLRKRKHKQALPYFKHSQHEF